MAFRSEKLVALARTEAQRDPNRQITPARFQSLGASLGLAAAEVRETGTRFFDVFDWKFVDATGATLADGAAADLVRGVIDKQPGAAERAKHVSVFYRLKPIVPLNERRFSFEEEEPAGRGKSRWVHVDVVTIADLGWGTSKERRALGATETVFQIRKLAIGESCIADRDLAGRTRFTRVS